MNFKKHKYFTSLIGFAAFSWLSFAQAATDCSDSAQTENKYAQTQISAKECHALIDLYTSTKGARWKNHTGWNVTEKPCNWYGVGCSDGHVNSIYLYHNKLSGSLPESLGNFSHLVYLNLGSNQLNGSLPESLGKLNEL